MSEQFQTAKAKKYFGDEETEEKTEISESSKIPSELQEQLSNQFFVVRKEAIEQLVKPFENGIPFLLKKKGNFITNKPKKTGNFSKLSEIEGYVDLLLLQETWQAYQSAFILAQ
ncbi:hypothetical protein RFI_38802, partial [Reticulomyxa filosa]